MPLAAGSMLSHYAILGPIGAGAMGEVWRARDTKLGREVAIKVLPEHFAGEEERLARFEREAKSLATLNHPNVAQIHGVDQVGDSCFLVLELVEGESLEERLRRGPLPLDEALDVCRQIAEGLEAAHEAGVIHRDLKPANIRVTPEGKVKVLDFGLAKPARLSSDTRSTDSVLSTEHGRLLGTPTYMAPEQARGKAIDRRIDIWAFGCVLYECLTGTRAFGGETLSDVLGSVLHTEPDLGRLPAGTPPAVRELLTRCLDKDSRLRLRDVGEARLALDPALARPPAREAARPGPAPLWKPVALVLSAALVLLAAWLAREVSRRGATAGGARVVRSVLELPPETSIGYPGISLARDGSRLLLVAQRDGKSLLLQRPLDELEFRPVAGSEGAQRPFLSADGTWVGFSASDKLRIVPVEGGSTQDLAEAEWGGGDWTGDGALIYTPDYQSGLWAVALAGGEARELTRPDVARGELGHWWPQVLPGGEHVLFTAFSTPIERARIEVFTRASGERKVLVEGASSARYLTTGHLLFARKGALFAVAFDLDRLEVRGASVPVVEGIATEISDGCTGFAVSDDGTLAYLPAEDFTVPVELLWLDRKGQALGTAGPGGLYGQPALSADGRWLALTVTNPPEASDVLVLDLLRGTRTPLTSGGASDFAPLFTPTAERVVFVSERPIFDLYARPTDGSSPAAPLVVTKFDKHPGSITPDGTVLFSHSLLPHGQLWSAPLDGSAEPSPLLVSDSGDLELPTISPDGRWLAYEARDGLRNQIYVVPYPDVRSRRRTVSTDGGSQPSWTRGGKELVYREGRRMLAVPFDPETGELGDPEVLFEGEGIGRPGERGYAVTGDGERFLVLRRPTESRPRRVVLVTNWIQELRARMRP